MLIPNISNIIIYNKNKKMKCRCMLYVIVRDTFKKKHKVLL